MRIILSAITVTPGDIDDEQAFRITLDDTGAGAYVTIESGEQSINIDPDEWPTLRQAINQMVRIATAQDRG